MRPGYVTVNVTVDVDEVLSEIPVDRLRKELEEREAEDEGFAATVERMLIAGNADEALLFVQRWRRPKFDTPDACRKAVAKLRAEQPRVLA